MAKLIGLILTATLLFGVCKASFNEDFCPEGSQLFEVDPNQDGTCPDVLPTVNTENEENENKCEEDMSATLPKCGLCMDTNMKKVESNPNYTQKYNMPCMETAERGITMNETTLDRYGLTVFTGNTIVYDSKNFKTLAEDKAIIFTVDAKNDAHIGFFSKKKSCAPRCSNEMYEIVIGGWGNSQSVIRRGSQGSNKVVKSTRHILKSNEDRPFWADAKHGLVRLGKGKVIGSDIVMKWQDNKPFYPSYVGFMTGFGSSGKWKISENNKDWCAKLYQHYWYNHYYNYGWLKVVGAGSRLDLHSYLNDQTSSVRVRPGCTLKLFKHKNCDWLLRSFTSDVNAFTAYNGNFNDQASSLTCTCH